MVRQEQIPDGGTKRRNRGKGKGGCWFTVRHPLEKKGGCARFRCSTVLALILQQHLPIIYSWHPIVRASNLLFFARNTPTEVIHVYDHFQFGACSTITMAWSPDMHVIKRLTKQMIPLLFPRTKATICHPINCRGVSVIRSAQNSEPGREVQGAANESQVCRDRHITL
jgi:hypothetical protein